MCAVYVCCVCVLRLCAVSVGFACVMYSSWHHAQRHSISTARHLRPHFVVFFLPPGCQANLGRVGAFLKNKRDQVSGCPGNTGERLFETFAARIEQKAPALLERLNGRGCMRDGLSNTGGQALWDTMKAPSETATGFSFGF